MSIIMQVVHVYSDGHGFLPVILVVAFIFVLIGIAGYYFSKQQVIARALKKANKRTIAEFIDGDNGKITGKVVLAGKTCIAPFSKRKCSYYQVLVEEFLSDGKNGRWITLAAEEQKGDIVLYDGSGYALIDTSHNTVADIDIDEHCMYTDKRPELKEFLTAWNIDVKNDMGVERTMRFMEGVLEQDEEFAVAGTGTWELKSKFQLE